MQWNVVNMMYTGFIGASRFPSDLIEREIGGYLCLPLRWRHVNAMQSKITSHSTADPHQCLRYWPFVNGLHRWPMIYPQMGQ